MRLIFALPLLAAAGCNVDRDPANDQTTISFNEERIEGAAERVGNAAEKAGAALENEIQDLDVDVDVDVNRNGSGNSN